MFPSTNFSPQVQEYLELNGYKLIDQNVGIGTLTFRRNNQAIIFFQDKIEHRQITSNKTDAWRLSKSFKGFDGHDIFKLMLILHLIDAVDLKKVRAEVCKKLGTDVMHDTYELFSQLPITTA